MTWNSVQRAELFCKFVESVHRQLEEDAHVHILHTELVYPIIHQLLALDPYIVFTPYGANRAVASHASTSVCLIDLMYEKNDIALIHLILPCVQQAALQEE